MQRTTITLPTDLVEELTPLFEAKTKTETVTMAIKDIIRRKKLERIKAMAGQLEFVASAEELRHGDERLG